MESASAESVRGTGPAPTTRPSRSSRAWVVSRGKLFEVVGGDDGRELGLVHGEPRERGEQGFAAFEVEPGSRFVEKKELGPRDERPGDQRACALAVGAVGVTLRQRRPSRRTS